MTEQSAPSAPAPRPSSSILSVGEPGSGKTTQALTLPKPLLFIAWEAKTREAIPPGMLADGSVQIEEFILEDYELSMRQDTAGASKPPERLRAAFDLTERYKSWHRAQSAAERTKPGTGWSRWASIVLDTYSTMENVLMAGVIEARGHAMPLLSGKADVNDTVPVQAVARNTLSYLIALAAHYRFIFVCNAHQRPLRETKGEDQGRVLEWEPKAYGAMRTDMRGMFTNTWFLADESTMQSRKFVLQTRAGGAPLRKAFTANSVGQPPYKIDVTLDWKKPLEDQGIGGLLRGKWKEA